MMQLPTTRDLKLEAREIADSRGRPTVEVKLTLGALSTIGDVPSGASKGEDEAQTMAVPEALTAVRDVILPMLQKANVDLTKHDNLVALDKQLAKRGGDNYRDLGANAVLPVSRALWRAAARAHGLELWQYIQKFEPTVAGSGKVHFLMNIFNGGLHAAKKGESLGKDRIDIQEIMVVPVRFASYQKAMEMGERIDAALKKILVDKFGAEVVTRGDEAGFTVKGLGSSDEAIGHVMSAIEKAGYKAGDDVKLALDVAASSFFDSATGKYQFQGKPCTTDDMVAYWTKLVDTYKGKVLSIEDGLAENDWDGWKKLSAAMRERNVVTVGDDLFVTQLPRLNRGIESKAATAILIKVNQNGSIYGTIEVMKRAKEAGLETIVSHRSGETLDDSIADLAWATGSFGLKTGDPQPTVDFPDEKTWARRRKYLRMLAIESTQR